MRLVDPLPRKDTQRLFPDNLQWMTVATTNTRLMAEYLRARRPPYDFADNVVSPHLIMCDWIISHNYVDKATALEITRQEILILAEAEQTLKSNLDTVRLIRDAKSGTFSNLDVYRHAIPLVWLDAQREFSMGNPQKSLLALQAGAELAYGQRRLNQIRIDAGLGLPTDPDHLRICQEEIAFRKAAIRFQIYAKSNGTSQDY